MLTIRVVQTLTSDHQNSILTIFILELGIVWTGTRDIGYCGAYTDADAETHGQINVHSCLLCSTADVTLPQ